jgi:hypothetical protein
MFLSSKQLYRACCVYRRPTLEGQNVLPRFDHPSGRGMGITTSCMMQGDPGVSTIPLSASGSSLSGASQDHGLGDLGEGVHDPAARVFLSRARGKLYPFVVHVRHPPLLGPVTPVHPAHVERTSSTPSGRLCPPGVIWIRVTHNVFIFQEIVQRLLCVPQTDP